MSKDTGKNKLWKNILQGVAFLALVLWLTLHDLPHPGKVLTDSVIYTLILTLGNVIGLTFNWFGRRPGKKAWLVFWLLSGAILSLVGMWVISLLRYPELPRWLLVYLFGYQVSFLLMEMNFRDKTVPPSPLSSEKMILWGLGIGFALLLVCSLLGLVDLVMAWIVWLVVVLPGSLYLMRNVKKVAEYAHKQEGEQYEN